MGPKAEKVAGAQLASVEMPGSDAEVLDLAGLQGELSPDTRGEKRGSRFCDQSPLSFGLYER